MPDEESHIRQRLSLWEDHFPATSLERMRSYVALRARHEELTDEGSIVRSVLRRARVQRILMRRDVP